MAENLPMKPNSPQTDPAPISEVIEPSRVGVRAAEGEGRPVPDEPGSTRVIEAPFGAPAVVAHVSEDTAPSRVLTKQNIVLGGYQLLRKLGEGAMGIVYLAWQEEFQRHVAVKVLFPHIANNPKLVERLYREGRAMGQLDHPNVVQAYAVGEDQGCHYVTMEYVDGQNLQRWIDKLGKLPVADAVHIAIECAKGLSYAHRQGMVHRDIKPDNILITRKGEVKIADLGMVKTFDEDLSLTQTGHAVGTPWYMPMEQAKNAKDTDGRCDIYALGCSLYASLTGQPPFAGKTLVEVIHAKELGTVPRARQINPDVPERLDLIIAKMASKFAKDRYQTCDEVIQALLGLGFFTKHLSFLLKKKTVAVASQPGADSELSSSDTVTDKPQETGVVDPNMWFVRLKGADGHPVTKRMNTDQLRVRLVDGTIKPTIKISRHPEQGFRAAATYREFEGAAGTKITQAKNDQKTAKYRDLYSEYDDREKQRDVQTKQDETDLNPYLVWCKENWILFVWIAGGFLAMFLMFWLGSVLGR